VAGTWSICALHLPMVQTLKVGMNCQGILDVGDNLMQVI